MRLTKRKLIFVALFLAVATFAFTYRFAVNLRPPVEKTVAVVIANQAVPANTTMTAQMLSTMDVPEKLAHPQAVRDPQEVIGKVTKAQLVKDEQILAAKIVSKDQPGNRFSYSVPDKLRAVTIAINEVSGVAGLPTASDRVDVILTRQQKDGTWYSTTILQNKEVLAAGGISRAQEDGAQRIVTTVTLAVTPLEAQTVALAENTGKVKVTLRPPIDRSSASIEPAVWRP